jgi:hypothetical protein
MFFLKIGIDFIKNTWYACNNEENKTIVAYNK